MAKLWLFALAIAPSWMLTAPPPASSTAIAFKQGRLEALRTLARDESKLLLVHFSAPWCQPCHWLERNTFADENLGALVHEQFVPVMLDAASDPQVASLCKQYGVRLLPTILILDESGRLLAKYEETTNAASLAMQLRVLLRQQTAPERPYVFNNPRLMEPSVPGQAPPPATAGPNLPPVTASSTAPSPQPQPNFSIQLGVFSDYANAVQFAHSVERRLPNSAQLFLSESGGRILYKVVYGLYPSEREALAIQQRYRQQLGRGLVRQVAEL